MEAQTNLDKIFNLSSHIDSLIPFIRNKYLIVCRGKTVHSRDNKFWHPKIRSKKHHVVVLLTNNAMQHAAFAEKANSFELLPSNKASNNFT